MKAGLFLDILVFSALVVLATKNALSQTGQLQIASPAFGHNQMIPKKYTCQGQDINPPLDISGIPEGTKSLILIVDDPDAPIGTWDHWFVYDILPQAKIEENTIPGQQSKNSFGKVNYGGPCPPSGTHRYFFKLYALDETLNLPSESTKADLEKAMHGHILETAELVGIYGR